MDADRPAHRAIASIAALGIRASHDTAPQSQFGLRGGVCGGGGGIRTHGAHHTRDFQSRPLGLYGTPPRVTKGPPLHSATPAERAGFEPAIPFGYTAFRERLLKPLGHLSATSIAHRVVYCKRRSGEPKTGRQWHIFDAESTYCPHRNNRAGASTQRQKSPRFCGRCAACVGNGPAGGRRGERRGDGAAGPGCRGAEAQRHAGAWCHFATNASPSTASRRKNCGQRSAESEIAVKPTPTRDATREPRFGKNRRYSCKMGVHPHAQRPQRR